MTLRDRVIERSDGRCEAMVKLPRAWVRCGIAPVEDHHALPRSRGGNILDEQNEVYHHIACCRVHHKQAHEIRDGGGLMLEGYAYRDGIYLIYEGPDEYLKEKYGREAHALVKRD